MCGIIGYVGPRECRDLLLEGLQRLEYRGYDSAGLSLVTNGSIDSVHAVGNLQHLRDAVVSKNGHLRGSTGIGHTRWATHGRVTEANAHPHWDTSERVHIVLNGIVENWTELRDKLLADGGARSPPRPTPRWWPTWWRSTSRATSSRPSASPTTTFAATTPSWPSRPTSPSVLVGARKECPLVVGVGEGEGFIASAIPAFLAETRHVQLVENGEIVAVTPEGTRFIDAEGKTIERDIDEVDWDEDTAEKNGFESFMLKEIHEQADAVAETVADRIVGDEVDLGDIGITDDELRNLRRVIFVACGTSYHAGLVGRYATEAWARMHVEIDIASEFRYRNPVLDEHDLVVGISQSGETADTLAAMRLARERGAKVIGVTNVMGSQATRDSDGVIFTRAGLEIGVAATKTFVAQVAVMYLLALKLAQVQRHARARGAEPPLPPAARAAARDRHACSRRWTSPSAGSRTTGRTRSSSSTSAATSACPCASRARSSSRRSPTSRPTPTRPAR